MKFTYLFLFVWLTFLFSNCKRDPDSLTVINSESFPEKQVEVHISTLSEGLNDTLIHKDTSQSTDDVTREINEMISLTGQVSASGSEKQWRELLDRWNAFNENHFITNLSLFSKNTSIADTIRTPLSTDEADKWARLNVELLKITGKARFGDALEYLLYANPEYTFPEMLLKSVIYTHVFDDIHINVIGSSSMEYQHTTGGTVRLVQETNYPQGSEMILMCETGDVRFMNIYIRIPAWAVNPVVAYGNVKYVAIPGEYCQISKKWRTGDEITVSLKN
ncbi:MAG: glycoside hydrolase family 127 protein [Verrucomicrobia bacterium]|nr:glycoside hydrolase family 127 protein [Prolixibacteraceae bacterium]